MSDDRFNKLFGNAVGDLPSASITGTQEAEPPEPAEVDDRFDRLFEQPRRKLDAGLEAGARRDPEATAKAQRLSDETGLPLDTVERDPAKAAAEARLKGVDRDGALKSTPALADALSDPVLSAQSQDDFENLSSLEQTIRALNTVNEGPLGDIAVRAPAAGAVTGLGMAAEGLTEAGAVAARSSARLGQRIIRGLDKIVPGDLEGGIRDLEDRMEIPEWKDNYWVNPLAWPRELAKTLRGAGEAVAVPEERQTIATDVSGALGQMGAQMAVYMASAPAGTAMLFGQGVSQQLDRQMATGTVGQSQATDNALVVGGAVTYALEKTGLDLILKRVPPKIRNNMMRHLVDVTIAGGGEALEEVLEGISHGLIEMATTNPEAKIFEGLEREAIAAGGAGAIMRGIVNALVPGRARSVSQRHNSQIEEMFVATGNSKLRQRNQEAFRRLIDNMVTRMPEGRAAEVVYIDPMAVAVLLQQTPVQPKDSMGNDTLENLIREVPVAVQEARYIEISTADFLTDVATTDFGTSLPPFITIDPEIQTLDAAMNTDRGNIESQMAQQEEMREKVIAEAGLQIEEDLTLIGYDSAAASLLGRAYGVTIENTARRVGMDPAELSGKLNVRVNQELPPELREKARAIRMTDIMLDRLRAGDVPAMPDTPSPDPTDAEILARTMGELEALLDAGGLDIQTMSNQEIMAALSETQVEDVMLESRARQGDQPIWFRGSTQIEEGWSPNVHEAGRAYYYTNEQAEAQRYGEVLRSVEVEGDILNEDAPADPDFVFGLIDEIENLGLTPGRINNPSSNAIAIQDIAAGLPGDFEAQQATVNEALSAMGYVAREYEEASGARSIAVWDESVIRPQPSILAQTLARASQPGPISAKQDFGDATFTEKGTSKGRRTTVETSAQRAFEQTTKRRDVVQGLMECMNG